MSELTPPYNTPDGQHPFGKQTKPKNFRIFGTENPIPSEIADSEELKRFFGAWGFVPYAGSTQASGHSLLMWYEMLGKCSPTHGACISKKATYAVGGKPTAVIAEDISFDTGEEAKIVPPAELIKYRDNLKEVFEFKPGGLSKMVRLIARSFQRNGNAWMKMKVSIVGGQTKVCLHYIKPTNALWVNTCEDEPRVAAISPIWRLDYLQREPPEYVPEFPLFTQSEDGDFEAILHLKEGDNDWYGRPETETADFSKYSELQTALYRIQMAAGEFTGKIIIETEESENGEEDWNPDLFEKTFTRRGDDPKSVVVTSRAYGTKPMFVFQVAPQSNQYYYQVTGKVDEEAIMKAHGVTARFMGKDTSNGFSSDVYISDFMLLVEPVVNELKDKIVAFLNKAITMGWQFANRMEMNQYSLTFQNPIKTSIDQYKTGLILPKQQNQPPANG